MGFFSAITGTDSRKESYLNTMHRCMRKLNEKADECDFNLRNYYNTTNAATFQEKSIMFFLANAAAIDYSEKETMVHLRGLHFDALSDVLLKFLKDNGLRGMDFKSYFNDIVNSDLTSNGELSPDLNLFEQGLFGKDLIIAEKYGSPEVVNEVLITFLDSLYEEKTYEDIHNLKETRVAEFANLDPKFLK